MNWDFSILVTNMAITNTKALNDRSNLTLNSLLILNGAG